MVHKRSVFLHFPHISDIIVYHDKTNILPVMQGKKGDDNKGNTVHLHEPIYGIIIITNYVYTFPFKNINMSD